MIKTARRVTGYDPLLKILFRGTNISNIKPSETKVCEKPKQRSLSDYELWVQKREQDRQREITPRELYAFLSCGN